MRWHPGDRPLLPRGPRLPRQVALHLPRGSGQDRQQERGQGGRGLDGRVEGLLLRDEPRYREPFREGAFKEEEVEQEVTCLCEVASIPACQLV